MKGIPDTAIACKLPSPLGDVAQPGRVRLTANEVGPLNGLGGSNPLVSAKMSVILMPFECARPFRICITRPVKNFSRGQLHDQNQLHYRKGHSMRRVIGIIASGILFSIYFGSVAQAGTLTDLNAQLAGLNITATELQIPCNSATNQSNTDVSTVNTLRQALVVDESNPVADKIAIDLKALATAVAQQESDESTTLSACTPAKLNQIDINEVNDKLARIAALPSNPTEQMITAAADGTFVFLPKCDAGPASIAGAYLEVLQSDGSWKQAPATFGLWANPGCAPMYGRWVIANLPVGTVFHSFLPVFPNSVEPNMTMQDYFSQYAQQKQQINADSQDAKASYTGIWESALAKDIQNTVNVASPLINALDARIKTQAESYPKNSVAYQQMISSEPVAPILTSDNSVSLTAAISYLDAVASFQASVPTQLQNLVPKPVTIQCVNGKKTKKVTGLSPKCPTGYKIRK